MKYLLCLSLMALGSNAFVPQACRAPSTTQVSFGFFPSADEGESSDEKLEKKDIGLKGLAQLITAGMGAPFLGDYQGVDKESGKFMFSLEANNLVDENGNSKQTSMPFFESGSFFRCNVLLLHLLAKFLKFIFIFANAYAI